MGNPALWTAIAGCIAAAAGLVTAIRAHGKASAAADLALGHALDMSKHPRPAAPPAAAPPAADPPAAAGPARM